MSVKPWQAHRHLNVGDKIAFYGPRKTRNWFLSIQLFLVWKDATCKARNSLTVTSFWVQSVEITERSVDSWSRLLSNSHWWSSEVKVKARSPQSLNKSFRSSGKHLDFRENRLRIRSRILLRTVRAVSDWSTDRYRTVEKKMSLILEFQHLRCCWNTSYCNTKCQRYSFPIFHSLPEMANQKAQFLGPALDKLKSEHWEKKHEKNCSQHREDGGNRILW